MGQRYSSAATSLKQVPAVFKLVGKAFGWRPGTLNLDMGGGKFDLFTEALAEVGVENHVIDPHNRTVIQNNAVRLHLSLRKVETATISNVLNVIREPAVREQLLYDTKYYLAEGGRVFITVYEGDRSSRGRRTTKGWQCNRPLRNYLREVRRVFPNARVHKDMIVAEK